MSPPLAHLYFFYRGERNILKNNILRIIIKVLNILQQHYVETLGRALVVNLPYLLNFFYKGISPFLDPVTRDKVLAGLLNI